MPSTAASRLAAAERRAEVLRLRLARVPFETIGARLDPPVSKQRAHQLYLEGLAALPRQAAEQLVADDTERLDLLWRALLPRAAGGSARHAEVALRVLERHARLHGLDAADRRGDRALDMVEEGGTLLADVLERVLVGLGLADRRAEALGLARAELHAIEGGRG